VNPSGWDPGALQTFVIAVTNASPAIVLIGFCVGVAARGGFSSRSRCLGSPAACSPSHPGDRQDDRGGLRSTPGSR
jgi:hypothetical protein